MTDEASEKPGYQGPSLFSYGFRPFFLALRSMPVWRSQSGFWYLPKLDSRTFSIQRGTGMSMRWSSVFSLH